MSPARSRSRTPPATLPDLTRSAVTLLMLGAVVAAGGFFVLAIPTSGGTVLLVLQYIAIVVGLMIFAVGVTLFAAANRWRRLRLGTWETLKVGVLPDEADAEVRRTLMDTRDGVWRIAIADYPLDLRDRAAELGTIEYAGQLKADQPLLVRVPGQPAEHFGVPKSRAGLGA